jgi:uncharacterized membrane protein
MACDCSEIKSVKRIGYIGLVVAIAGVVLLLKIPRWIEVLVDPYVFWLSMALCVIYGVMALRASLIQWQWNDQPWYYPHTKADAGNQVFPAFPRS